MTESGPDTERLERYARVICEAEGQPGTDWMQHRTEGERDVWREVARAAMALADEELAELEGVLNHERDAACASIQGERVATSWHLTRRAEAAEAEAAELRAMIAKVRAATPTLAQLRAASARHEAVTE